ncbi:unnamed protein product [Durusdinium trenchii]|uniref:Uncharacterized protein n=1 Tax=Durusdinium trenchii TaxID=1381693 RepID=A0ABP0J4I8_9DINO
MARSASDDAMAPLASSHWQYEPEPKRSALGSSFACCAMRQKPNEKVLMPQPPGTVEEDDSNRKVIWDTADLTWWDFQRRRWKTLWLMRTVYFRYKGVQERTEGLPEGPEREKQWVECHTISARELRLHAEEAKGLFIKAGQVMSAMVGTLPDAFTNEFLSLTDHLPVSRLEEVYRIIQRTFQKPPKVIFSEFDPEPLASASIAQVHKARLRSTNQIVAVKVQHDGVDRIFLEDIETLTAVAEQVSYWAPDLDFRKFAEEWRESLPRELDFCHEHDALERAGKKLREAGNCCIVPEVHHELCGAHVFVMEFIDAGPILDLGKAEFCAKHHIDKHRVLTELLHAFGIMAFKDGMFHADPHAGNVRLVVDPTAPGGAKPVLLDWGLIREITDAERLGLAKVFHSLANFDIAGLFDVLESLGFSLRQELVNDDLKRDLIEKARGVVKDTINRHKTRENAREELAEFKARLNRAKEDAGMEGSMSPIYFLEDWPRCIIFFMRMLQILRGLCVAVDAEGMPLLQIFSSHAREALQEGSRRQMLSSSLKIFGGSSGIIEETQTPFSPKAPVKPDPTLVARLRQKLSELQSKRQLVGAQVAVVRGGEVICNLAHGTLSTIDARLVNEHTRFPLLGATAGLAGLAFLRALRRRSQELIEATGDVTMKPENVLRKMLVSQLWPSFSGCNPDITLADVLSHRIGLQDAFPPDFTQSSLDDLNGMVAHLEQEALKVTEDSHYAYILQSFVLAKLGSCIGEQDDFLHWLGAELGSLGLDVALPAGRGREASICRDLPDLARVSMQEVQAARSRRKQKVNQPEEVAEDSSTSSRQKASRSQNLLQAIARDPLVFDPLQGNAGAGGLFRGGLSICASARGLAELLASEELHEDLETLHALALEGMDKTVLGWILSGGATHWTAGGLQALDLRGTGSRALRGYQESGYGVVSGFGPVFAHFPGLDLTVAVLVNDVIHGRKAAEELVTAVLQGFGVAPSWPKMTMNVVADAAAMANSKDAAPLLDAVGGMEGLSHLMQMGSAEVTSSLAQCCHGICRS